MPFFRKTRVVLWLITVVLLCSVSPSGAEQLIRVGLAERRSRVDISSSSALSFSDRSGKRISAGRSASVMVSGSSLRVNGQTMAPPVSVSSSSMLIFNKRRYLGRFDLLLRARRITVVNVLGVESYLRGVLKMEANPSWPIEALKVQAIISRTYALRQIGRHSKKGYDVCDTHHCQAYRGGSAHDPVTDRAIAQTRGMVLTYRGRLAKTFFHSDCGGVTAAVKDVWGGDVPYLRSVADPIPSGSPYMTWTASLKGSTIGRALERAGFPVGVVSAMTVLDRDASGRVRTLLVTGSKGQRKISGHRFRMAVGSRLVKSTAFQIRGSRDFYPIQMPVSSPRPVLSPTVDVVAPLTATEEQLLFLLTKQGAFTSKELIEMLVDPSRKRHYLQREGGSTSGTGSFSVNKPISVPIGKSSHGAFVLKGRGWGHGVGLSQWGARALALSGWPARKILYHYYPGTTLTTR
ncbi:MAG: stage II sporulation protein SpoIID [Dethiosulfovibrio peptidovorans]|nr:MAG: stage II sporulation protein SpoIID [Dethiosulfovibrio peptidovorans]